jgi:HrpA-like RNA helicase
MCFRLYTEDAFENMRLSAEPEIKRCSLTQSVLQLKCLGQDIEELDFMDSPHDEARMCTFITQAGYKWL